MKTLLSILALSTLGGCVSGTLSDTVGATETLSFAVPTLPKEVSIPACTSKTVFTTEQSTSIDVSDAFQQLEKQGSLSVNFNENQLSGDLSSFQHAAIYISNTGDAPELLSETDFTAVNGAVPLAFTMDQSRLFQILSAGAATVVVDLSTCVPANAVSITYSLQADVSLSFSKP